ncbi:glycosyltransferase family 2 protein [Flavobacterium sp.]|jgi:dolichol-phosphate mannosyltransferase|uniref:glycosyltransferase family 2 protein n=1 Tax=Flavobacterium sp. TaxID=239 RepID=UPI0022C9C658|nr:glycosyltransferase family 2 protein [Flavobacterium sp.]MCZ8229801.1 glycosyltransferase family 2 protein [Flavobacterium sp.]
MNNLKKIAVVIPSYNEEGNIEVMVTALHAVFSTLNYEYDLIFVDDGSNDRTLERLKQLAAKDTRLFFIELSRNFGHQNALKAGVDTAKADAVITMDGDMQHPPELIPKLLKKWEEGYDVVYTRREEDKKLTFFKKKTSKAFYKLMNYLSEVQFEPGTADFRLMDEKVVSVFSDFSENELFIRGVVNWLGFKQFGIDYQPAERFSGESKYTIKKMMRFAIQGITSFSIRPLYIAIYLGLGISFLAFMVYIGYVIYSLIYGHVISGWASLISTVVFFGGLNLIVMGIIGIYVGKLFMQSKNRPNYLIKETNYK